ncbi:hypothetical protein SCHPADRAFT_956583 [Schizopora paradoxa]|uniref:Uncharacterized protein n=1 Tax=Schizopora paradoxa TaxID=27342 RepID=A0A0H2S863_9AGAM|nr:hypothetical protein SCHPADRAFT_956583 [Schizopora paradoxa]
MFVIIINVRGTFASGSDARGPRSSRDELACCLTSTTTTTIATLLIRPTYDLKSFIKKEFLLSLYSLLAKARKRFPSVPELSTVILIPGVESASTRLEQETSNNFNQELRSTPKVVRIVILRDGFVTSQIQVSYLTNSAAPPLLFDADNDFPLNATIQLFSLPLLSRNSSLLMTRPMLTQCLTAAVLFGGGDVIAQQAVERKGLGQHDLVRTARQTFFGGVLFAPIMTKWYGLLNRLRFATPTKALVYRVYLDQLVLSPVAVVYFYSCMTLLEGKSVNDATERVKSAYISTLVRNWGVFVPTQIVNFAFVPGHLRFVFMGTVSLFWNTYLSYANMQAQRATTHTSNPEKVVITDEWR